MMGMAGGVVAAMDVSGIALAFGAMFGVLCAGAVAYKWPLFTIAATVVTAASARSTLRRNGVT